MRGTEGEEKGSVPAVTIGIESDGERKEGERVREAGWRTRKAL